MLKTLFGRNASEEERERELRKLNDALHNRVKKYSHENEEHQTKPLTNKPE